jgi:FK506-binding protein 1
MGKPRDSNNKEKKLARQRANEDKKIGNKDLQRLARGFMAFWFVMGVVVCAWAVKAGKFMPTSKRFDGISTFTIEEGDGTTIPAPGDTVRLHYSAKVAEIGKIFDTTFTRGPAEFVVGDGKMLRGMEIAVQNLTLGEIARINVSAAYGFGAKGNPPSVPANADLEFEFELIGVNGQNVQATSGKRESTFGQYDGDDDEGGDGDDDDDEEEEEEGVPFDHDEAGERAANAPKDENGYNSY